MTRAFVVPLALVVLLSAGACDDGVQGPPYYSNYSNYSNPSRHRVRCEEFTTCASCTPVLGCGWCSSSAGNGCVSGPDWCGAESFNFTWDIQGCGVSKSDAGTHAETDAAAEADARVTTPADGGATSDAQR